MDKQNEEASRPILGDADADATSMAGTSTTVGSEPMVDHGREVETGKAVIITRIILYLTVILSALYCGYFILAQKASVAIKFSRYLSAIAALFMILSIYLMIKKIGQWRKDDQSLEQYKQHVSKTVIVFIGALSAVTFAGYVKMIPTIIVLYKYDVALDYTAVYEVWLDLFYNFVFILFLPILFTYSVIFAPFFKTYEKMTNILICTHLLCFLQKWMYETLTINEHICQEMLEDNRTYNCTNRLETHFVSNLQDLTNRERHLYDSLIDESPYMYTFTMELLPANAALLVSLKRRSHDLAMLVTFNDIGISKQWKTRAYVLLVIAIVIFSMALLAQPILCMLHDKHELREWALFGNGFARFIGHLLSTGLFAIVWWSYRQPNSSGQSNLATIENTSRGRENHGSSTASLSRTCQSEILSTVANHSEASSSAHAGATVVAPKSSWLTALRGWLIFNVPDPDLLILVISGWFTFVLLLAKFIVHIFAYALYYTPIGFLPIMQVFLHDFASFVLIASFFVQYEAIKTFYTFDKESMKVLIEPKHKFVIYFAPGAFVINVLRFGAIYLSNANYLAPYPTDYIFFDNLLSILDSAYPGSLLFSMTAAICWAHIIERLYNAGAYRVIAAEK